MTKELTYEDGEKYLRERTLAPEEQAAADAAMERFKGLEVKRRIAKVVNIVETPEVVLEKICSGLTELQRLPIENEILDGALSVQAQRFRELSGWFATRNSTMKVEGQADIADELDRISIALEEFRMEVLTTGNKVLLSEFIRMSGEVRAKVLELWRREDDAVAE